MRLLVAAAVALTVSTAALADDTPASPTPSPAPQVMPPMVVQQGDPVWMQRSKGCFWGAIVGGVIGLVSSGGGVVPGAGIGCGVSAMAAPAAVDLWNKYRWNMAMLMNDAQFLTNRGFAHVGQWLDGYDTEDPRTASAAP